MPQMVQLLSAAAIPDAKLRDFGYKYLPEVNLERVCS